MNSLLLSLGSSYNKGLEISSRLLLFDTNVTTIFFQFQFVAESLVQKPWLSVYATPMQAPGAVD